MSLRPPSFSQSTRFKTGVDILGAEMQEEKAYALGRAGRGVEEALARLNAAEAPTSEEREALLKDAAYEVWKFFIQRECCGIRDHKPVIEHFAIPKAILLRLGAR